MANQRLAAAGGSTARATSVAASAGLGVVAALVGYLLTFLLAASDVRADLGDVPAWKGVAWYFYNAHLVEVESTGEVAGFGGTTTIDFIAESETARLTLLYAVPPVALLAAGALVASHLGAADLGSGVVLGAPVTIGYLLVLGLGAVVSESHVEAEFLGIEATATMAPELPPAIVLGGVLYPLVFATTGAILVALARSR